MRVLGLDVGEKRIGVARADSDTKIAVPVGFIKVDGSEWQEIARIAKLNSTNFFVLGLPRSNEGNETRQTLYVRNFARVLMEKLPEARVRFQDESLTSVEAESRLKKRQKKYEKGDIDAEAASIILQDFIESFKATAEEVPEVTKNERSNPVINGMETLAENTKNLAEKQSKKVALNTRKAHSKLKKILTISPLILMVIIISVLGVTLWQRQRVKEREEYFARLEAEMQPEVFNFTILPGETIFDIKKNLAEEGYDSAEIEEAFNASYDFDFLKDRPAGATLEGYLYGETHEFYKDTPVSEILATFLAGMGAVISENNLEVRYAERGLSLHEGITLASIVQKEARSSEQPTVAQVFLSRLNYGWRLGSDVTVAYALDVVDPNRNIYQDNQAALTIDSCYNTRIYTGLPCGPISNPGLSALLAVAEPSDTAYLFFLTGDDGMMYYSYTEAEHIQNIYSHCQELCNISL